MILFLYLFIIDYLLVVRACICQALFGYNFLLSDFQVFRL